MKTLIKRVAVVLSVWAFVACGGGGAGTSVFGAGDTATPTTDATKVPKTIDVATTSYQVGTAAGSEVMISAYVNGPGGVSLADAPVLFSADTGILNEVASVTDASGVATAKFRAGSNKNNRTATISIKSGAVVSAISLEISGTTLAVGGPAAIALNDNGQVFTVKATDSQGNGISGLSIAIASKLGNEVPSFLVTTSSSGVANFPFKATVPGDDTLTFSISGTSTVASTKVTVSGEDFAVSSPVSVDGSAVEFSVGGAGQRVTACYSTAAGAQNGVVVSFATTGGSLSNAEATTGVAPSDAGCASTTVTAVTAGPITLQASITQGGKTSRTSVALEAIATTPKFLVLQVSPTALAPTVAGATAQQAEVVAKVTDEFGNPVKGKTVTFTRMVDPSAGNLSQASAVTGSAGTAKVQYVAGPLSTSSDGVKLSATVAGTSPAVTGEASLTVNQQALFIALGTGNVISNFDDQTYEKNWTVYVTDSNGARVPGVALTMKLLPSAYRKGYLSWDGAAWSVGNFAVLGTTAVECPNEDENFNGVLDATEDKNGNATLEPGNVISLVQSNLVTDATGRGTVTLRYAESYVPWVKVKLQAKAVVNGTESIKVVEFYVEGLSDDFTKPAVPPAGLVSPFGKNFGFKLDDLGTSRLVDSDANGKSGCDSPS